MTIFHWNPIRQISDVRSHSEYSTGPVTFYPKNYVRQRKHKLYNNLFILLAGLWALTISHDIDISDTDTRARLKKILASSSLCLSHLVVVPLIIWKLNLHYSIILGAMGMGVVPFFYYVSDPVILSVVICLRVVFEALFDVSAMIYIVKLARICSSIQGNPMFSELLTMRSLIMIFSCTANIASITWQRYTRYSGIPKNDGICGLYFCPSLSLKETQLTSTLSTGQNIMFVAVAIVIALSGIILIAMYLKPITSLGDLNFSREPQISNPWRVMKQFEKSKSIYLALLITICVYMYSMTDEILSAYATCHYSTQYTYFIVSMKQVAVTFGVLTCVTLVDFTGFRWLYTMALCGQLFSYICLVSLNPTNFNAEISYLVIFYVLCTSIGIEMSLLQLLIIQTISDEEVSAWCFFYVIGDIGDILRLVSDVYFCTGTKLWILIGISPFAVIANSAYWYKFDENVTTLTLYGPSSQLIKTSKEVLAKSSSFDLKIVIEEPTDIRKVETFLQRSYTLKSRFLVPPPDDVFSDN